MLIAIDHFANYSLFGGLEHEFYDFPYVGNNNPNWRTHMFQMGWNHQPVIIQPEIYEPNIY